MTKKRNEPIGCSIKRLQMSQRKRQGSRYAGTFKPSDVAKMHHHPDHVVYALKGDKMSLTTGGKTQETKIKAGQPHGRRPFSFAACEMLQRI